MPPPQEATAVAGTTGARRCGGTRARGPISSDPDRSPRRIRRAVRASSRDRLLDEGWTRGTGDPRAGSRLPAIGRVSLLGHGQPRNDARERGTNQQGRAMFPASRSLLAAPNDGARAHAEMRPRIGCLVCGRGRRVPTGIVPERSCAGCDTRGRSTGPGRAARGARRAGDDYRLAHGPAHGVGVVSAPTVIVSGMIAATPGQGGATWAVLQYLLGLRRLGCEVYFVEPVDEPRRTPARRRYCDRGDGAIRVRGPLGAASRRRRASPIGMPARRELRGGAGAADLLLNVSGMLTDPDVLDQVPVRAYLDLDPVFTQLWHAAEGVDMRFDAHTHFVTVADAIGAPGLARSRLRPRLAADAAAGRARASGRSRRALERRAHHHRRPLAKLRLDPPRRRPLRPEGPLAAAADRPARAARPRRFELALAIHPDETNDLAALEENGWTLLDPGRGRGDAGRLPPLRAGLVGRVRARQVGLRGVGLRLVQRSQRLLPGLRAAGDRPGHRLRPPPAHRRGPVRLLHRRRRRRGDRGARARLRAPPRAPPGSSPPSTSTPIASSARCWSGCMR